MLVRLLHPGRDFDPQAPLCWNAAALIQDLGLETVIETMAGGDGFIAEVVRQVLLAGEGSDASTILYRQQALQDCQSAPAAVRALYALAAAGVEVEKHRFLSLPAHHPSWMVRDSAELLGAYLGPLRKLRAAAATGLATFTAPAWVALRECLRHDLSDPVLVGWERQMAGLKFREGMLLSARLGAGNKGIDYGLLQPRSAPKPGWRTRRWRRAAPAEFSLDPRDESGLRALEALKDQGLATAAIALSRSAEHIRRFFSGLRAEVAFYIGCLNLGDRLLALGLPICMPGIAAEPRRLRFHNLCEPGLALRRGESVVGNDADADERHLILVTGANQGGKSTFLRSLGVAQLMLQAGMFVSAATFHSSLYDGVLTHYRREEDAAMQSGRLDGELVRMSAIVDHVGTHPLILFNESFAATNEREGSEIAHQILTALLEAGAKLVCVTHLFTLAREFQEERRADVLLLRAEREAGGRRPFKLVEGEPLPTSFGADVYRAVFGEPL